MRGCLDGIGGAVALDHGLTRRHADDRVCEIAPAGLAQSQPAKLDDVTESADGGLGLLRGIVRRGVHQHPRVLVDQAACRSEDVPATDSAAIASPFGKPPATAISPQSARAHAAISPAKWNAFERSAPDL